MTPKLFSRFFQKDKTAPADAPKPAGHASPGLGAVIGQRFRLDAEIGRGGMGIVYRAHDTAKNRDVALKLINLDKANALSLGQFAREAEIMSRLDHPNIVAVYETGTLEAGGRVPASYIVMELVQGVGLDTMRGFTYARILDIGTQICAALEYAHGQGFVHRDLKPANVLVEKHGFEYRAKLMDFGLARPRGMENLPMESNTAGTIYYLAPEVIAGQPADVGADLYALGVILYEMITGRVPFSDFIDDEAILAQHLAEAVAPPSHSRHDVPPALEALVLRLLAKDPGDRFPSAREVRLELEQVRAGLEADGMRGNLPQLPSDFVPDSGEVAQLKQLLASNQLVTILGEGEKLALAAATQLAEQFPDGMWLVELASLHEPAEVLPTVAAALGLQPDPQRPLTVSLMQAICEKHLLLILNHCDQLQFACAQLAETLLRACPEVRILVTSGQALQVQGEVCYFGKK